MNQPERELFEKRLLSIPKGLEYPPTPDISASVMARLQPATQPRFISRRLAWSLTIFLILLTSLMLIPPARAAILEFIQIGIVRIFPGPSEATVSPTAGAMVPVTSTPSTQSSGLISTLDQIAGKRTLLEAVDELEFPVLLPAYPSDLGEPNYVFVQDADGKMAVLVWLDPRRSDQVLMSLHFIPSGSWAIHKVEPAVIQETNVNGQDAIWATGPYALRFYSGDIQFLRLIDGHVLIWVVENITYRLETGLPLEEALKVAESLQPISLP